MCSLCIILNHIHIHSPHKHLYILRYVASSQVPVPIVESMVGNLKCMFSLAIFPLHFVVALYLHTAVFTVYNVSLHQCKLWCHRCKNTVAPHNALEKSLDEPYISKYPPYFLCNGAGTCDGETVPPISEWLYQAVGAERSLVQVWERSNLSGSSGTVAYMFAFIV
jgi:hypothetical protein